MSISGKSTQIKVIVGYVLLSLLLFFSVSYIYRKVKVLTEGDGYEQKLNKQRRITYRFLTELYQAEIIGQSVSAGQINDLRSYRHAMKNALQSLDSLQNILTDSLQIARLDTLATLLKQKQQNMRQLIRAMKEANTGQLYSQKIETIIRQQDTTHHHPRQIQKKVTIQEQQSYVINKHKKSNFFQRLAQAFSKPKEDSTLITSTTQEIVTDTLVQDYNPADTVTTILRTIQMQVNDSMMHTHNKISLRIERFRQNGWELSSRINQLLQTFEEQEQAHMDTRLALEQRIHKKSAQIIGVVAIIAIVLVAAFLFMIERDITRSNHYRQELEKAKKRAESLLVAREKLMLTITHDIKAPTGSILGYIDLLTRLLNDERQRFYLQSMKSSATHLLNLVKSLLDFHRLESHKMEINPLPFNPHQLFETICTSYRPLVEKKGLQLFFKPDPASDCFLLGDPFRIRQIADNLLSNALKFTSEGSITLRTQCYNGAFSFTVQDTGSGISEEEQQRMFQEFTRLKNAQGEEGFGLGLAITQRLVILMKGTIRLESQLGLGSAFTVRLPLEKTPETPQAVTEAIQIPIETRELPVGRHLHIIFIDDDRIQLDLTKVMLQHPQLEVTCCNNPDQLFESLQQHPFDLLFTDIQMPAMNGFELVKHLRTLPYEHNRNIPAIALTARSDMKEEQFLSQGFAGHLHKPYTQSEILELICRTTGWRLTNLSSAPSCRPMSSAPKSTFNFSALTAFSEDDPEASQAILHSFIEETRQNRERLAKAVRQQDCSEIRALAHKQIPLFTMLEATDCLPTLMWLERENYDTFTNDLICKVTLVLQQMETIIQDAEKLV